MTSGTKLTNSHLRPAIPRQFSLKTLCGLTFAVCVSCSLFQLGTYVAAGASLLVATVLVRSFVQSPYQRHVCQQLALAAGVLFVFSLWLPVDPDRETLGWQVAKYAFEVTIGIPNIDFLTAAHWVTVSIVMSNFANLTAIVLPIWMLKRPRPLSTIVTCVVILAGVCSWALALHRVRQLLKVAIGRGASHWRS